MHYNTVAAFKLKPPVALVCSVAQNSLLIGRNSRLSLNVIKQNLVHHVYQTILGPTVVAMDFENCPLKDDNPFIFSRLEEQHKIDVENCYDWTTGKSKSWTTAPDAVGEAANEYYTGLSSLSSLFDEETVSMALPFFEGADLELHRSCNGSRVKKRREVEEGSASSF